MKFNKYTKQISAYFGSLTIISIILLIFLLFQPSHPNNRFILIYSHLQSLIIFFVCSLIIILSIIGWNYRRYLQIFPNPITRVLEFVFANKTSKLLLLLIMEISLFGISATIMGEISYKFIPIFIWLFLLALITFSFRIVFISKQDFQKLVFPKDKKAITKFLTLSLFFFAFLILFLNSSDLLKTNSWNLPTVGISVLQGFFILIIITIIEFVNSTQWKSFINTKLVSISIIVFLFVLSGITWNQSPFNGHFFVVGPFPPGDSWFPHSDSVRFDLAAQSLFIGKGINFGNYSDNPLMVGFVALLHYIVGGEFSKTIILQVWIFSIIPPLIYILGKKLFGISAGIGAALLYYFRMINIIPDGKNNFMVSPRIYMSEGLLEPFIIIFVLFFSLFIIDKNRRVFYLIIMGGLLGLSSLIRANIWFIPVILIFVIFLIELPNFKNSVRNSVIFFISLMIVISPWMWRSVNTIKTPFYMLFKFQNSIYAERYGFYEQQNSIVENKSIDTNAYSKSSKDISERSNENSINPLIEKNDKVYLSKLFTYMNIPKKYSDITVFTVANMVYNLGNSFLVLPQNPGELGIQSNILFPVDLVNQWITYNLSDKLLFLTFSLASIAILSAGILRSYRYNRWTIFPLLAYLAYILASSIALTRGSRYTQPVEWIFFIYYSGGITFFIKIYFGNKEFDNAFLLERKTSHANNAWYLDMRNILLILFSGTLFLIPLLLVFVDSNPNISLRFRNLSQDELKTNYLTMAKQVGLEESKINEIDKSFINNNYELLQGRIIYSLPLVGDKTYEQPFFYENPLIIPSGSDQIALFIINNNGGKWVIINLQQHGWPKETLVWKNGIFVGCKGSNNHLQLMIVYDISHTDLFSSDPKIDCEHILTTQ
jgi:hypothetical protein